MDLSGLIFVALAVAWAAYLIPKALRHHDDVARGRSIDGFSESMRVLARREPVSARMARLVVTPARRSGDTTASQASPDEWYAAHRAVVRRATKRRRRVLSLLMIALVAVVAGCASGRLAWVYVAVPSGLLLAWLVACRVMVRAERAGRPGSADEQPGDIVDRADAGAVEGGPGAQSGGPVEESSGRDPKLWDPVPVTLPTYVSKPPARRTVRTIDLDATGVWTSGRTEADSALAREAEAAERVRRRVSRKSDSGEEAVGS